MPQPNTTGNTFALHQYIPNRADFYPHTDPAMQYIVLPQTFKPPPNPLSRRSTPKEAHPAT
ncbi:hypothetical protein O4443_12000 [Xylella fastidiosa subsp. pauca]|uniref:Uncharacterized protein n=1 Tax=Xylella fastidiosa (strain 9a5c) TaxID=160492 RepID=Q9P9U4_XYLFA|nr:hypothetical protein [Xylella fastidiosa]AAF85562.1 hypothetical protein XF_2777 [Xylella fastidiosa 9a5c]WGZ36643.1 hypothetical protein O4443_12000 [Xylella fastidiosa subsp. pauca]